VTDLLKVFESSRPLLLRALGSFPELRRVLAGVTNEAEGAFPIGRSLMQDTARPTLCHCERSEAISRARTMGLLRALARGNDTLPHSSEEPHSSIQPH
jgi:hypothetical protein